MPFVVLAVDSSAVSSKHTAAYRLVYLEEAYRIPKYLSANQQRFGSRSLSVYTVPQAAPRAALRVQRQTSLGNGCA